MYDSTDRGTQAKKRSVRDRRIISRQSRNFLISGKISFEKKKFLLRGKTHSASKMLRSTTLACVAAGTSSPARNLNWQTFSVRVLQRWWFPIAATCNCLHTGNCTWPLLDASSFFCTCCAALCRSDKPGSVVQRGLRSVKDILQRGGFNAHAMATWWALAIRPKASLLSDSCT